MKSYPPLILTKWNPGLVLKHILFGVPYGSMQLFWGGWDEFPGRQATFPQTIAARTHIL